MLVNFKKINEDAVLPFRNHEHDAGLDITAIDFEYDSDTDIVTYKTGFAVEIPEGHCGLIFPRSSVYKKSLSLSNSIGLIDSNYRGEVLIKYRRLGPKMYINGERVAQLVIIPYPKVTAQWSEELSVTDRGDGGHGSTGV